MDYLYFYSNAKKPLNKLSNFNECKIKGIVRGKSYIFPCSEHYYLAHFLNDIDDIKDLEVNGKYGTYDALKYFFKEKDIDKKIKYWSKKNNIGIVAKMLKNNSEKLNIELRIINKSEKEKIWTKIILDKYTQNQEHKKVLLETNDKILIEFGRGSKKDSFYTGKIVDGELIGKNYMGEKIMEIRKKLIN